MHKADIVSAVAHTSDIDLVTARCAVDCVFDTILQGLASQDRITITNFGVFDAIQRSAQRCIDPRTGSFIEVEERLIPKFRFAESAKARVRKHKHE